MLRDVVVHLHNEQPVLADLLTEPTAQDTCLICTNLRTMNGKKPVFVDRADSTFVLPMAHIRFIEVHAVARRRKEPKKMIGGEPAEASEAEKPARRLKSGNGATGLQPSPDEAETFADSPLERLDWAPRSDIRAGPQLRNRVGRLLGDRRPATSCGGSGTPESTRIRSHNGTATESDNGRAEWLMLDSRG